MVFPAEPCAGSALRTPAAFMLDVFDLASKIERHYTNVLITGS